MKYFLILVFGCWLCLSASAQKKERVKKIRDENHGKVQSIDSSSLVLPTFNVSIYFTHHYPYCGGAYPDESQLNNYQPLRNHSFLLINLTTNYDSLVKADSTGTLNLNLAPGKYGIKELYKNIPFEEFYQKYNTGENEYTQSMGKECYQQWWSSLMLEFRIVDNYTKIQRECSTSEDCFTGKNPCLSYFGPYPP